jgi:hypothetical protein
MHFNTIINKKQNTFRSINNVKNSLRLNIYFIFFKFNSQHDKRSNQVTQSYLCTRTMKITCFNFFFPFILIITKLHGQQIEKSNRMPLTNRVYKLSTAETLRLTMGPTYRTTSHTRLL